MELCETTGSEMKYAHLLAALLQCSIDRTITKEGRDLNVSRLNYLFHASALLTAMKEKCSEKKYIFFLFKIFAHPVLFSFDMLKP